MSLLLVFRADFLSFLLITDLLLSLFFLLSLEYALSSTYCCTLVLLWCPKVDIVDRIATRSLSSALNRVRR